MSAEPLSAPASAAIPRDGSIPISRAAWIAWSLFAVCVALWGVTFLMPDHAGWQVLRHGAEGGIVGCLCDFLALQKLFAFARKNFDDLCDGVASGIVSMLGGGSTVDLRVRMRTAVQDPQNVEWVRGHLQALVPDRAAVESTMRSAWNGARPVVVEWLVGLDDTPGAARSNVAALLDNRSTRDMVADMLRQVSRDRVVRKSWRTALIESTRDLPWAGVLGWRSDLDTRNWLDRQFQAALRPVLIDALLETDVRGAILDGSGKDGILSDKYLRSVVAECLRRSVEKDRLPAQTMAALRNLAGGWSILVSMFLSKEKMRELVNGLADAIEKNEGEPSEIGDLMQDYLVEYLDAWHSMDPMQRRAAATRLIDRLAPPLLSAAAPGLYRWAATHSVHEVMESVIDDSLFDRLGTAAADALVELETRNGPSPWTAVWEESRGAWARAWQTLPIERRRLAAGLLVQSVEAEVVTAVTDGVWNTRESWIKNPQLLRGALERVSELVERLAPPDVNMAEMGRRWVRERLQGAGPDVIVGMLERQARPQLDNIQLNGTGMGILFGSVAGALSVLGHWLAG